MQAGMSSGPRDHSRLEVVEDELAWTAAEAAERGDDGAVEVRLLLGQGELQIKHAAVAQHSDEDGDASRGLTDADRSTVAPIHLHRIARLPDRFLVHTPARRPDATHVATHQTHFALVS